MILVTNVIYTMQIYTIIIIIIHGTGGKRTGVSHALFANLLIVEKYQNNTNANVVKDY